MKFKAGDKARFNKDINYSDTLQIPKGKEVTIEFVSSSNGTDFAYYKIHGRMCNINSDCLNSAKGELTTADKREVILNSKNERLITELKIIETEIELKTLYLYLEVLILKGGD